jgi:hypothetical protein
VPGLRNQEVCSADLGGMRKVAASRAAFLSARQVPGRAGAPPSSVELLTRNQEACVAAMSARLVAAGWRAAFLISPQGMARVCPGRGIRKAVRGGGHDMQTNLVQAQLS